MLKWVAERLTKERKEGLLCRSSGGFQMLKPTGRNDWVRKKHVIARVLVRRIDHILRRADYDDDEGSTE